MRLLFKLIAGLIVSGGTAAQAYADTIFSDDFETGTVSAWTTTGTVGASTSKAIGTYSMRLRGTASGTINLSSVGYSNVSISMSLAATSLENNDDCYAEFSTDGGSNWSIVTQVSNGQDNGTFYSGSASPASAEDNANLVARFRGTGGTTGDYCYGDNVLLSGDLGGINPAPEIDAPVSLAFGNVQTGTTDNSVLTVSNSGDANLSIGSISGLATPFTITSDSCSNQTVSPLASCAIGVSFSPTSEIFYSDSLSIPSNDADENPFVVNVSGTGSSTGGGPVDNYDPLSGSGNVARSELEYSVLMNGTDPGQLVNMSAFALPVEAAQPSHNFEGRLVLQGEATGGGFDEQKDTFRYTGNSDTTRKHLPEFDFDFVQTGTHIFPVERGAIASSHPEWEYIFSPGRVWQENNDFGYSRVSIPFALMQKNANCVHNGAMSLLFKDDGSVSKVSYQISAETCLYFKVDMWGLLDATYTPASVSNATALKADYQAEVANRMPRKPFSDLASDYPGVDLSAFSAPNSTDPTHVTLYGFVINGTHYSGGCETRNGPYPFCEAMVVPSYSAAKSTFGGVASMRLEQKYPGTFSTVISNYVPACAADGNWSDVTVHNALDMATGNYGSGLYLSDEGRSHTNGLFLSEDHASKINYSCTQYSRKSAPGTKWVYHTSDTYILGRTLNEYLKATEGSTKDIFADTIVEEIWKPINLSPTAQFTRRTYDSVAQPFTGWGLMWMADDVAKITNFLNVDDGQIGGQAMLDPTQLSAAMQKDINDRGLDIPIADPFKYNNGMWAHEVSSSLGCANNTWIPFMSGYGGITIVMMPNDTTYYMFSDDDTYFWLDAAIESNSISNACQ